MLSEAVVGPQPLDCRPHTEGTPLDAARPHADTLALVDEQVRQRHPGSPPTRERLRAVAEELYVLRGHDGFSFADIVGSVGTTRANVHHHFGNKRQLMAELVEGFTADAEQRIAQHWMRPGVGFFDRLDSQVADLRSFYHRFNATPGARNVWSPIARLRLDLPALGEPAIAALERVNRAYTTSLRHAVAEAHAAGELAPRHSAEDVERLLRITLLACGPITQDTGSFADVERLFAGIARILAA
jgi:TetR/AcrR family transcriptional repressor of nem operon